MGRGSQRVSPPRAPQRRVPDWTVADRRGDRCIRAISARGARRSSIARYSTCCTETRRGRTRSLSMVGKLFPTTDPKHALPLRTANFITQEDIGGADTEFINDAELRNAPDTTASRRGAGAPLLLAIGLVFGRVDRQPTYPSAVSDRRARQTCGNADAGAGVHAAARRFPPAENRRRRSRLPRRSHGADIRPWRSRAQAHAHIHDRSDRSGTDHRARAEAATHVSGLARDRVARSSTMPSSPTTGIRSSTSATRPGARTATTRRPRRESTAAKCADAAVSRGFVRSGARIDPRRLISREACECPMMPLPSADARSRTTTSERKTAS